MNIGIVTKPALADARETLEALEAWLQAFPGVLVHRGDADVDAAGRAPREVLQQVDVAHDHRPLGDDAHGVACAGERLERAAGEAVGALDRLVRVCGRAERRHLTGPRRLVQLSREDLDEVDFDEDDGGELIVGVQLELRLVPAGETVVAPVRAAPVGVERPAERHSLDRVQG